MNARDKILQRIRSSLSQPGRNSVVVPEIPEIYPKTELKSEVLQLRFAESLTGLSGECFLCPSVEAAAERFSALAQEQGWNTFSSTEHPLLWDVAQFPRETFYLGEADGETDKNRLSQIPVSLLFPQFLLADTGSAVMLNRTAHERLSTYLTPACVLVAKTSQLREHLPAVWSEIARQTRDGSVRGEYVLVTGPSRTADIEKITVLGVHGPKKVVALLIEEKQE